LAHDPSFADAYYLKYLNYLRLRDYPSSLKSLHDYFDRLILAGSVSLAALNLCSLEYRFNNKENSMFALKEAITSAHQEVDNTCLQHCLSWLYKMDINGDMVRKKQIIKSACAKAINNELYGLAVYNLHFFARSNIGKHKPQSILNLLNKTDIVNLKINSKIEFTLLSQCHKAALWNLYGHRKLCSLHSQMLLNLLPKSVKLNTESQCISICYLALDYCRNGDYDTSQKMLQFCKETYSVHSKISEHWFYTENLTLIEKYTLNGKWDMARGYIEKLASISLLKALLQEMNIYILEVNLEKAKEIGNKILLNINYDSVVDNWSQFENPELSNQLNELNRRCNSNSNDNNNSQFEFWNEQMNIK
jgi:anaphase-promoting complex subunit 5